MVKHIRDKIGVFRENIEITKWVGEHTERHLCACGCENYIKITRAHYWTAITKYILGHNAIANRKEFSERGKEFFQSEKGKRQAKEHGEFMKEYWQTHDNPSKGRIVTKEEREHHSKVLKEKYVRGEIIPWQITLKGNFPKSALRNMALAKIGKRGPLSNNWQGGKSFEKYGMEFDDKLKESIRHRDKYKCVLCWCSQLENGRQLSIHHIDYNKNNNDKDNLISLCISCHTETNGNRKKWTKYFQKEMLYG